MCQKFSKKTKEWNGNAGSLQDSNKFLFASEHDWWQKRFLNYLLLLEFQVFIKFLRASNKQSLLHKPWQFTDRQSLYRKQKRGGPKITENIKKKKTRNRRPSQNRKILRTSLAFDRSEHRQGWYSKGSDMRVHLTRGNITKVSCERNV